MNPTPLRFDNQPVTTVQVAGAFAVYNPYNIKIFDSPTMHYTIKLFSAPNRLAGHLEGSATDVDTSVPTLDGQYRLHNTLFSVRCSSRFFNCVTTYLSIPEALRADRTQLALYTTLGGMAGAFLGFICSLLYRHNRSMEQQLRRAIALDEVQVVYQPIVNLTTRRIVGAEALARWTSEDGVVVNPEVFIRLAENLEFVGEITRLVVRKSLRDLGEILRSRTDFRLSINVTAMDLSDPEFLPMLDLLVERAEVSTMNMAIEITEGSTANQDSAIETLRHLRERGYSVHIDDFGTGYSSLSYLRDLSVDAIKIDRSFTQAIGTDAVTVGILPQILAIAEALHLEVIVEGVETRQQADYFGNSPLPVLAQGWLFGRPITSDEFQSLLIEDERKARMDAA
jgi:sensor c-di-GMP phosphodiesterase-like protein